MFLEFSESFCGFADMSLEGQVLEWVHVIEVSKMVEASKMPETMYSTFNCQEEAPQAFKGILNYPLETDALCFALS